MNSKTMLTLCAAYNLVVGLMLYFMAEGIALQTGVDTAGLNAAIGGNMNTGTAFLAIGILTFTFRDVQGMNAKKGLIGWGIGGSIILLELLYRMTTNEGFNPPMYFLISGALLIALAFFSVSKIE